MKKFTSILVTGGTGTFGNEFVRQLLRNSEYEKIVIFSRDEFKQFHMEKELLREFPAESSRLRFFIGDVRDLKRLEMAFNGIDVVVHAAAMKQVPACEYNPFEAIKTNVIGAQNIVEASIKCNVKKVIALSTDKAVNPANLYGGTKLLSDRLFIAANNYGAKKTIFSVVRYGNIVGSRGSIIPLAIDLAKKGNKLLLTDSRMTRFWMTIDKAVNLVLRAIDESNGGELFVAKNPSFRVVELLEAICPECEIENIGIRPGEKLHETLISFEESRNLSDHGDYFIVRFDDSFTHDNINSTSVKNNDVKEWEYTSKNNQEYLSFEQLSEFISKFKIHNH
jgi:UDP-N-acetylglucosamine 4,6-dehydratase (inverting)